MRNWATRIRQHFASCSASLPRLGITVAAMSQWIGDFAELALDPDSHRKHIDGALKTLELQGEYGIGRQLHYVDLPEPEDPADDEAMWEGMLGIYRELIAQAESSGVKLANHAIWRCLPLDLRDKALEDGVTESDYRQYRPEGWAGPYLVRTADHIGRIIDSVPSESNGAALCTGMYITGADPCDGSRPIRRTDQLRPDQGPRRPMAGSPGGVSRNRQPGLSGHSSRLDRRGILRVSPPRTPRPASL